jgi:hypothetical protein
MNRATTSSTKWLGLTLGVLMLSSSADAAGVDSRNYTCPELQRLILTNRFIFINNPNFEDFVVSDVSYCGGGAISGTIRLRTVPTKDLPECPVNYCLPAKGTTSGN